VRPVLPGATLGILGGGQLGRMLALEARRLGYRVAVLDPMRDSPAGQVADERIIASFDDVGAALRLARNADVVTYEFENVDVRVVEAIERMGKIVRPGSRVLKLTQNRLLEKSFLRGKGVPVTPFHKVDSREDLDDARRQVGLPAVLKTASGGYDGKGQAVVHTERAARAAFHRLGRRNLIWERFVPLKAELSVIAARTWDGKFREYPIAENVHRDNILWTTVAPARIPASTAREAVRMARKAADGLDLVGVFCLELFWGRDGRLLANELAPRPHNSGHYTLDACRTSQFEQQLRAVCGLPLGSTAPLGAAAMVNILGNGGGPRLTGIEDALSKTDAALHLYGKAQTRPGRKMGHLTAVAGTPAEALKTALRARRLLTWR